MTTLLRRCLDAAWGYKTGKGGQKEVGYGFHQHTVVRTADPNSTGRPEPLLVEGLVVVPANEDVVDASLRLLDRIQRRSKITRLAGDLLYTNLKADRWAVPLAQRGIEQILAMREDSAGCVDINGAVMQYGWMHCPAAPMDQRPLPATFARDEDEEHYDAVEEFKANWAFDRKESGLGRNPSIEVDLPRHGRPGRLLGTRRRTTSPPPARPGCPSSPRPRTGRRGPAARTRPWTSPPTRRNPHHQRKLMQREYVGTRRWRRAIEPPLQRGGRVRDPEEPQPAAACAAARTGCPGWRWPTSSTASRRRCSTRSSCAAGTRTPASGPADHPLLQPDPHDWGFTDLTKDQAKEIDARYLLAARDGPTARSADEAA